MKHQPSITGMFAAACLAGVLCGELAYRSTSCRNAFGLVCGRGRLLALVHGAGIYEADVQRAIQEAVNRGVVNDLEQTDVKIDRRSVLAGLVANARAEDLARYATISRSAVHHEYDLLRYQLRPEQKWLLSVHANGYSKRSLHRQLAKWLQTRDWIEQQIATAIKISPDECLQYYQAHPEAFSQPIRFRASHFFLAAPAATATDVIEAKRSAIKTFSDCIAEGENFADLVSTGSEDEATKARGGDLNYFSESRMPSEFFAIITKMRAGEVSAVVRTHLGFHIVQVTDKKPAAEMTFEQSQPEIRLTRENLKRRAAVESLQAELSRKSDFIALPAL